MRLWWLRPRPRAAPPRPRRPTAAGACNLPPAPTTGAEGGKLRSAGAGRVPGGPVAPSLVTAGTDSRYLQGVANDVYRFQPMAFGLKDVEMIHGTNEHLTLKNLEQCVQF